ncbi:MAG: tyrosine-type recombinase/integrase [Phycisphaeraceae bacterium]
MASQKDSSWIDAGRSADRSPAAVFLASLAKGSRRTMHQSLASLASTIVPGDGDVDPMKLRWEKLRRADTTRLRVDLKERYAPSTANKMLSALRGVLRTCRDMKLMAEADFQAAASLEQIKPGSRSPAGETSVTPRIVSMLFAACAEDRTASGRRDAAMLAIFLSSGLRRAEAAQLDMGDYTSKSGQLHIRGERPEYDRHVTLGVPARLAMSDWLAIRSEEPGPLILPVDRGGIIRFRRMTDQAIYDIFSRILSRAQVEGVTLRDLRRAYVISLIRTDKPMEEVQQLIGHASWFTTTTYQDLAKRKANEGYDVQNLPYEPPNGDQP